MFLWLIPADVSQICPVIRCKMKDDIEPPPPPPPLRQKKANFGGEVLMKIPLYFTNAFLSRKVISFLTFFFWGGGGEGGIQLISLCYLDDPNSLTI